MTNRWSLPRPATRGGLLLSVLVLLATAAAAQPRSLFWRALDVDARLDAEGRLHVIETHTMVFTGTWNGGERSFDGRRGQTIRLVLLERLDRGRATPLEEGRLDRVDRFAWSSGTVLRWRSRLPSDPPFDGTELIYRIGYEIAPVLVETGDRYRLDHDFGMARRAGPIEHFTLDLELHPVWQDEGGALPSHDQATNVPPGQGHRVTATLTYSGTGQPLAATQPAGCLPVLAVLGGSLLLLALTAIGFLRHERARGRFEPPDVPRVIDRPFLETTLFIMRPEEVGALWDGSIGGPEVAAVIARLVAEGKLASRVIPAADESHADARGAKRVQRTKRAVKEMSLTLLAERDAFQGYERKLIDKLFWDGRTETDTAAIRAHYRHRWLNAPGLVRSGILARLRQREDLGPPPDRVRGWPWLLILVILGLLVAETLRHGKSVLAVAGAMAMVLPLPLGLGTIAAIIYRASQRLMPLWATGLFVPPMMIYGVVAAGLAGVATHPLSLGDLAPGIPGALALALLPVVFLRLELTLARTRQPRQRVLKRRRLLAVREHFRAELRKDEPDLDDDWFPYLLAFGLDRQVDRWSHRQRRDRTPGLESSAPSYASSSGRSFTGGGGRFGGAGATASWTTAAAALGSGSAGTASRGSSRSFSGGSSGGSFSGGGGGGGW